MSSPQASPTLSPPPDAHARMRQLAAAVMWTETLGKARSVIVPFNNGGNAAGNDAGAAPPFYCVHSLSGKATDYAGLAMMLGPDQPFYGLQIPSANRNPGFGDLGTVSIEAIAGYYADELERFQPAGALALGGWSVGAVLALELARQLRSRGRIVSLLVAFDLAPWNTGLPGGARYRLALARNLLPWLAGHRLVKQRSGGALLQAVLVKLGLRARRKKRVQTLGANIAVGDLVDPAHYPPAHGALMKALLDATMAYRPAPYDGRVQVYVAGMDVSLGHRPKLAAAWRQVAACARVTVIAGTHRSMLEKPDGESLARHLARALLG
jgi:thioesterase domain-containing protein